MTFICFSCSVPFSFLFYACMCQEELTVFILVFIVLTNESTLTLKVACEYFSRMIQNKSLYFCGQVYELMKSYALLEKSQGSQPRILDQALLTFGIFKVVI